MSKEIKVKIIAANPTAWSYDFIGKDFDVQSHDKDFYILSEDVMEEDERRLLRKSNCEIVENSVSSKMEHTDGNQDINSKK